MKNSHSRRRFLQTTAKAAVAFTIVPRYVLGGNGYIPPSDRLNIALVGAGGNMAAHDGLMDDYKAGALKYSSLKEEVAETVVALVNPFRERLAALQADKKAVKAQIQDSSAEIRKRAQQTMKEVRELTGLINLR